MGVDKEAAFEALHGWLQVHPTLPRNIGGFGFKYK